ncbi:MAG: DUF445 domain-containing protein [Desulfosporosinus sp.]|nr:DUF445 domain-containing protein [Desulfosporosinus sp.]
MTRRKNNARIANFTLGGMTLGFLLSYPFHAGFVGGFISSGCSAGMIGGLADWFAVTALFRRPLGIRPGKVIRTEIIPQNRERIFVALADMVQDELLSQDVLRRKLSAWDFSGVLLRIFGKQEVKRSVALLLMDLAEDMVRQLEQTESTRIRQGVLQANIDSLSLAQTLAEVLEFSLEHGDVDQVLTVICGAINDYVEQPELKVALMNTLDAALTRYGANNPTRKMVVKFLPAPSVLAHGLQARIKTALQDGTVEQWLKDSLFHWVLELKMNASLQESFKQIALDILSKSLENSTVPKNKKIPSVLTHFIKDLEHNWDEYLGSLERNRSFRSKLDDRVKLILEKQIGLHHKTIGRMVHEGLDPLTDDKLVELIEEKAGNDLQMIRINGSVVGGLVGIMIYVLGMVLK